MPSVRGRERVRVVLALVGAAIGSGGLTGFASGVLWAVLGLPPLRPLAACALVVAALAADVVVPPLAVRRQVPQAWGRLLPPTTAAILYGARLGPGPLTLLNTWLWWAALVVGASAGPWPGAAVAALFALGRVGVMVAVGAGAGRLRRHHGRVVAVSAIVVVVVSVGLLNAPPPSSAPRSVARTDGSDAADRGPEVQAGAPTATSTPPPATDPELAARLPEQIAPPFAPVAVDGRNGLGSLDLAGAAALEDDHTAERTLLETRAFEVGLARAWSAPDGRTAYAAVYRFGTAAGAQAYLRDGGITLEGRGARRYPVEGLADALGFSQVDEDASGARVSHGVAFVEGRHFVLVLLTGPQSPATAADDARALAMSVARLNPGDGAAGGDPH